MEITKDFILHVAKVSRITLTDSEAESFVGQFEEILKTFEKVKEVDTTGVEPSFHPIAVADAVREDEVKEGLTQEETLTESKNKDGYFIGPKAV